jgi:polyhydroxyalkanoate synthesis repressor PhaR
VTLSEVKELVINAQDIQVLDSKNGEDLTRSILLQIILEEETAGVPMFSQAALVNIIRFYGQVMHGFMGTYIEKNMQSIMDLQVQMSGHKKPLPSETWQSLMAMGTPVAQSLVQAYTESSREAFDKILEQLQEQMQAQTNQMLESLRIKPKK